MVDGPQMRAAQAKAAAVYAAMGNTPEDVFNMQVLKAYGYEGALRCNCCALHDRHSSRLHVHASAQPWTPSTT